MLKTGIGQRINLLISKNKVTKTKVAKHLKIARPTLDDYINEKTSITVDKLYELAQLLGVNIVDFFTDDNSIIKKNPNGIDRAFENFKIEIKNYIDSIKK